MKKQDLVEDFKRNFQEASRGLNPNWRIRNPEKYEAAKALYREGSYSLREIGRHFGVSYEGLRKNFMADGVKMRNAKGKK